MNAICFVKYNSSVRWLEFGQSEFEWTKETSYDTERFFSAEGSFTLRTGTPHVTNTLLLHLNNKTRVLYFNNTPDDISHSIDVIIVLNNKYYKFKGISSNLDINYTSNGGGLTGEAEILLHEVM